MFGGYVGQEEDRKKISDLKACLQQEPDNEELKKMLKEAEEKYNNTMRSALISYSKI